MTNDEVKQLMERLMNAFPSFGSWVAKHHDQIGEVWKSVLVRADQADAEKVVDDLINGEIEMPANYEFDRMAILIRKESKKLTSIRNERTNQIEKYFKTGAMEKVGKEATGHIAIVLGELVKAHQMTPEESKQRMTELLAWDKGGAWMPWMESLVKIKRKKNVLAIK